MSVKDRVGIRMDDVTCTEEPVSESQLYKSARAKVAPCR